MILKVQCVEFQGIYLKNLVEMEYNIKHVFSSVSNLKSFSLPLNEPFISTEGAGPAMFIL